MLSIDINNVSCVATFSLKFLAGGGCHLCSYASVVVR